MADSTSQPTTQSPSQQSQPRSQPQSQSQPEPITQETSVVPETQLPDAPGDEEVAEEQLDASIETEVSQHPLDSADQMQIDTNSGAAAGEGGAAVPSDSQDPTATAVSQAELRINQKKDASLREFLGKMDDYAPIIPDAVTNYYLTLAGLPPPPQTPIQLTRLLSLATQKFIADIAADAYQYARIRASNTSSSNPLGATGTAAAPGGAAGGPAGGPGAGVGANSAAAAAAADKNKNLGVQRPGYGGGGQGGGGQGRTVLTMEDLGMAVGEYGVNVKRSEFYR